MRVIINNLSERAILSAGWRAKAIEVNDKTEATLIDALKAAPLKDGRSMYDLIADEDRLKISWGLYVDGFYLPASSNIKRIIKDNIQIHVWDCKTLINFKYLRKDNLNGRQDKIP